MVDYVFVHGGGQAGWVWAETITAMRRQDDGTLGQLLTLDVPGCGSKRQQRTDSLTIQHVAADLVADIEKAGLTQVVLVGHSQAGQVLPFMARLRPDIFRQLVYVTCSAPLPGQTVLQMMGDSRRGTSSTEVGWPADPLTAGMSKAAATLCCNDMNPEQASAFLAKLGKDMWPLQTYSETGWHYEDLGSVRANYVVCLKDVALPVEWQIKFAGRLQTQRLIHIDAGHQIMNTRPHALAEVLRIDAIA